jgi:hypothetical protein
MIRIRRTAISLFLAVLAVTPFVSSKDVKLPEAKLMVQPRSMIKELPLQLQRHPGLAPPEAAAPSVNSQDLSTYREFQFGMPIGAIAKLTSMKASESKVIHQRPAMIQELNWRPLNSFSSSTEADPIKAVLFSFYDGQLFRMVVNYDRSKTEGLTTEDVVEAISGRYGTATRPAAEITFTSSQVYDDSEVVIARWEDSQYSFNLFRSSYQPTFGMIAFSKKLDALARAAVIEAILLDEQEAPQREIARQEEQAAKDRAGQAKARLTNKPNFRP